MQMTHEINLLTENLKAGDEKAFEKLFYIFKDDVYTYALSLIKSPEVAKEVVQETFIKVWSRKEQIKNKQTIKAYIFTIARNLVIDTFRKTKRDLALREEVYHSSEKLYHLNASNLDEVVLKKISNKAIQQLSPKRKEVFLLSREAHLSYVEISEQLGISVNTVKNHITKALDVIREYLHRHSDLLFWWLFFAYYFVI